MLKVILFENDSGTKCIFQLIRGVISARCEGKGWLELFSSPGKAWGKLSPWPQVSEVRGLKKVWSLARKLLQEYIGLNTKFRLEIKACQLDLFHCSSCKTERIHFYSLKRSLDSRYWSCAYWHCTGLKIGWQELLRPAYLDCSIIRLKPQKVTHSLKSGRDSRSLKILV